jgi:hypothetical protein
MHSTAQPAPAALEIFNETASTGDAWIRQRKQHMAPQKSSTKLSRWRLENHQRNCFNGGRMHSKAQTATAAPEIFIENVSTGDACIRQRKEPMRLQKSSTKLIPLVTHAFDSANSPCGFRNLQRNCFH